MTTGDNNISIILIIVIIIIVVIIVIVIIVVIVISWEYNTDKRPTCAAHRRTQTHTQVNEYMCG